MPVRRHAERRAAVGSGPTCRMKFAGCATAFDRMRDAASALRISARIDQPDARSNAASASSAAARNSGSRCSSSWPIAHHCGPHPGEHPQQLALGGRAAENLAVARLRRGQRLSSASRAARAESAITTARSGKLRAAAGQRVGLIGPALVVDAGRELRPPARRARSPSLPTTGTRRGRVRAGDERSRAARWAGAGGSHTIAFAFVPP